MTYNKLAIILNNILDWGLEHNKEFRECLINATGLTEESLKDFGLDKYVNEFIYELPKEDTTDVLALMENNLKLVEILEYLKIKLDLHIINLQGQYYLHFGTASDTINGMHYLSPQMGMKLNDVLFGIKCDNSDNSDTDYDLPF